MPTSRSGAARWQRSSNDTLGVDHDLALPDLDSLPVMDRRQRRAADLAWARTHAAPWVQRRIKGTSTGDGMSPRRPALEPVTPAAIGTPAT